jgi:hypothetical protein
MRHFAPIQLANLPLPEHLTVRTAHHSFSLCTASGCKQGRFSLKQTIDKKSFIKLINKTKGFRVRELPVNWEKSFRSSRGLPNYAKEYISKALSKNSIDKEGADKEFNKFFESIVQILVDSHRKLVTSLLSWPVLDLSGYQTLKNPFEKLSLVHLILSLFNASRFLGKAWWIIGASVGGIAATSEAHALSLLSVRLSAIRPFLPAGLTGEPVSDSNRQNHYSRGDGADAPATI